MEIDIVPSGGVDLEMMRDLGDLCDSLKAVDVPVRPSLAQVPGVKDSGLTIAIQAAGVAISALSALVSALAYWSSRKPRYTLTVQRGSLTLEASQLDKAGVQTLLEQLRKTGDEGSLLVRVEAK